MRWRNLPVFSSHLLIARPERTFKIFFDHRIFALAPSPAAHMYTDYLRTILSSAAILQLASCLASAQWLDIPSPGIPRLPDGKPNLSAPAPKMPDGRPDISGIWQPTSRQFISIVSADPKSGDLPFQPWAEALFKQRRGNESIED